MEYFGSRENSNARLPSIALGARTCASPAGSTPTPATIRHTIETASLRPTACASSADEGGNRGICVFAPATPTRAYANPAESRGPSASRSTGRRATTLSKRTALVSRGGADPTASPGRWPSSSATPTAPWRPTKTARLSTVKSKANLTCSGSKTTTRAMRFGPFGPPTRSSSRTNESGSCRRRIPTGRAIKGLCDGD